MKSKRSIFLHLQNKKDTSILYHVYLKCNNWYFNYYPKDVYYSLSKIDQSYCSMYDRVIINVESEKENYELLRGI